MECPRFGHDQTESTARVWQTYGFWAFWVGVTFFAVYPACNWISAQRTHAFAMYLEIELHVPFVPEFAWLYLSMYILFAMPPFFADVAGLKALGRQLVYATVFSGIVFFLLPTKLGFVRTVPEDPFYGALYSGIFLLDLPHNMVPSLHVVFSALILLTLADPASGRVAKLAWWGWLTLICISTMFVHQHHLLDVAASLAIVWCFRRITPRGDFVSPDQVPAWSRDSSIGGAGRVPPHRLK